MDKKIRKIINGHPEWASFDLSFSISNDGIVTLAGQVDAWDQVVEIGHKVAELKDVRNVVNHLTVKGMAAKETDRTEAIKAAKELGRVGACDCVIIGAGIIGCAIARALSKYELKVMVVDKNNDVAEGTTKANNGNIHPGVQAKPGTLKAELNLLGNAMYDQWAEELNFSFKRTGSLDVIYDKKEWRFMNLVKLVKKSGIGHLIPAMGQVMKTPGLQWLSTEELMALEPHLAGRPLGGLLMKTMGLVEPYEVCIALAENAAENGTKFMLETEVLDLLVEDEKIAGVVTSAGIIQCGMVINAAGLYADEIAAMGEDAFFTIHPRRGAIAILDKSKGHLLSRPAGVRGGKDAKAKNTKGGGASVTPEGNLLWGPTAEEVADKSDTGVKAEDLPYILSLGARVLDGADASDIITSFAGLRAADYKEDFIVEASRKSKGLIHAAAIQSPGLASAPAIAEMVEGLVIDHCGKLEKKADYNPIRKAPVKFRDLSHEARAALIDKDPRYGKMICRCEMVTEGEILDAIHSPIPARTLDAVKRRTRAGMGRCQSGFCGPRVVEILAREWGVKPTEITKKGQGSKVLLRDSRP